MRPMWSTCLSFLIVLLLAVSLPADPLESRVGEAEVRPAAVAGRFYPGDPGRLMRAVDAFMQDARSPSAERPIALIAPHAGYIYSGQIAADAYRQAVDHDYDLIVILGANHTTAGFDQISVYQGGGYLTPLGVAEIDTDVAAALLDADGDVVFDRRVHEREHSVEVHVPFVQHLFPRTPVVTAIVGSHDLDVCRRFGTALARAVAGRRVLIVASSDLSHYPDYDAAIPSDRRILEAIAGLDPDAVQTVAREQLLEAVPNLSTAACGEAPVLAAMFAARELGATRGVVVSYANSGDAAVGDPDRVVGYGAVVLSAGRPGSDTSVLEGVSPAGSATDLDVRTGGFAAADTLSAADRVALLALARRSIDLYLSCRIAPLARDFPPELRRKQGAFVTLKQHGQLRGCIGHMAEDLPLCRVVGAMALQAAFNDRRFEPLSAGELESIEIEISVLTPHRRVSGPDDIVVGRDGVVLRKAGKSAVYLPHVAVEQGWDRDTMLGHLARKAGLPADAWRADAEFSTFQAEVFGE